MYKANKAFSLLVLFVPCSMLLVCPRQTKQQKYLYSARPSHLDRSELLSLSLEADKQSSRHHQASAEAATETARFVILQIMLKSAMNE